MLFLLWVHDMAQKAITIYTPESQAAHIYAENDAQIWRGLLGGSGIMTSDTMLRCSVIDLNTVKIEAGIYSNQGYLVCVESGTVITLSVDAVSSGSFRNDLIVAHFVRGGESVADSHTIEIVKGTEAGTAATATDPVLVQNDLRTGGAEREEAIYRIKVSDYQLTIQRVAGIVGNVYR